VQVVGRADIDHVDIRIVEELPPVIRGALEAELSRGNGGARRIVICNASNAAPGGATRAA
jgi:hypothetical protein